MKYLAFLAIGALFIAALVAALAPAAQPDVALAATDWCDSISSGSTYHAVASIDFDDVEVVAATEDMEVSDPYLNPCFDAHGNLIPSPGARWAAQVLWIYKWVSIGGTERPRIAEIGWRKRCNAIDGAERVFYFACCSGWVTDAAYFADGSGGYYGPQVGKTYEVSLEYDGGAAVDVWRGKITGPGLPAVGIESSFVPPSGFAGGRYLDVGGENYYKINDMGVAGHLNTIFELSSGATGNLSTDTRTTVFEESPRYRIVKGSHTKPYYQTFSDIHIGATPTAVATQALCSPGWG